MKEIALVSLGCAKNLVDSEMILGMFRGGDYKLTSDPSRADLIIVNTCGFIEDAKREAISVILDMAKYNNAKLLCVGCFVQRNKEELAENLPEVDAWCRIEDYHELPNIINKLLNEKDVLELNPLARTLSTPPYFSYLRISDGCNNFCSFCAIPYIRGRNKSRSIEEIVEEAKILKNKGIKELALVSQDPGHYGSDFKDGTNLSKLMKALDELGFYSIRVLYLYPSEVTDEDLETIKNSKTIEPYFDIPVQCGSDHLLKLMNRHGDKKQMVELFEKIDSMFEKKATRTTLITGFPGETEEDHQETLEFIKKVKFDHLGCFMYSKEEGTVGYKLPDQIDEETKKRRYEEIMEAQAKISYNQNKLHIGEVMEGIVVGYDFKSKQYKLRSYWNAPDDIDGNILFTSNKELSIGDVVSVKIKDALIYDIIGEIID